MTYFKNVVYGKGEAPKTPPPPAPKPKTFRCEPDYSDPARVLCLFTYEELDEISESLKFTARNDPDVDKEFNAGLNLHVRKIMKRVRKLNPQIT